MSGLKTYSSAWSGMRKKVNYEMKVQTYEADVLAACGFERVSTFAVTSKSSTAVGGIELCEKGVVGLSYEKSSPGSALQGFTCVMWQYPLNHSAALDLFGVLLQVTAGIEDVTADATFSLPSSAYGSPRPGVTRPGVFRALTPLELLALASHES